MFFRKYFLREKKRARARLRLLRVPKPSHGRSTAEPSPNYVPLSVGSASAPAPTTPLPLEEHPLTRTVTKPQAPNAAAPTSPPKTSILRLETGRTATRGAPLGEAREVWLQGL